MEFDLEAREGQPRRLSESGVKTRLAAMRANLPTTPAEVLLWLRNPHADRYVCLGGQHTLKATLTLRDDAIRRGEPLQQWMTHVSATVIRPDTPIEVREKLAGDHQNKQGEMMEIPLSRMLHFIRVTKQRRPTAHKLQWIADAIQISGRKERETVKTWDVLQRNYLVLLVLVDHLGEDVEPVVAQLEQRQMEAVTVTSFRKLRKLYTHDHRQRACDALREQGMTTKKWEDVVGRLEKEMWVDWHWAPGNPKLSEDKGTRPCPVLFC